MPDKPANRNSKRIATAIIRNVEPATKSPASVARHFRNLLTSGHRLRVDGQARNVPESLLQIGYTPKYEIELFGVRFFACNPRNAHGLKVLPAYVLPHRPASGKPPIHARVFYKDSSLVWRAGSHYICTREDQWIGKGAVKWMDKRGRQGWFSAEETTNLPFEMQQALDDVSRRGPRSRGDQRILGLMLRNAPASRVRPYQDFERPRSRDMQAAANRINNNRPIAWFTDDNDPASLRIKKGFEPDFDAVIDAYESRSSMYGGKLRKIRIASRNRQIQYFFVAGPNHVWLVHPQAFTTKLSSYGVRTVDVVADEDIAIPGYEFFDNDGSGDIDDQIPEGYAGPVCPADPDRADASPWNDRLPIIAAFREAGLARVD